MLIWQKLSLLLVLYSLPSCSTDNTYYVTPIPDTPCPGEPCHTLSQYAEHDFKNFSSNTTLVFLPGDHALNHTISFGLTDTLSDWRNTTHHHYPYHSLTLLGSPSSLPEATSRIVCTRSAGFAFSGITELHITALAFISCGHGPAVSIWWMLNSSIVNCTFQNNFSWQWQDGGNIGEGSVVSTLNSTLTITGCTIQNNGGYHRGALVVVSSILTLTRCMIQNNGGYYGGAVFALDSILTLTENIFENNTAESGGALFIYENNILILTQNTFQNNLATISGGSLFVETNNTIMLIGNVFENNLANSSEGGGGALYAVEKNTLAFAENMFLDNLAGLAGGAVDVFQDNTLILTQNVFQNNIAGYCGGVLFVNTNNNLTLTGNTFQNNSANFSGGALTIDTYNVLTCLENIFQNNFAEEGGVIIAHSNNILTITHCMFQSNAANELGGALAVADNNTLILKNNTFQNNLADDGGALYVASSNIVVTENTLLDNYADSSGGALYIHYHNTISITNNTFQDNFAGMLGGCLISVKNNTITLTDSIFLNNLARFGGVLLAHQNSTLTVMGNCFHNNDALNGGVLYTKQSNIDLINNDFSTNLAQFMGAVIFCTANSNLSIQSQHRLWNNTARYGGGMAALDCQVTLAGNTSFENNTASYGGGLYADGSHLHNSGWTDFINNSATKDGGGVYASRSVFSTKQGVTFQENSALNNGGGMMLIGGSKIYLQQNTYLNFTCNSAKQKGGALMIQESNSLCICTDLSCEFLTGTDCFFQIQTQNNYDTHTPISEITELHNIRIYFKNNTALEAGATLYGSFIDYCSLTCLNQKVHETHNPYECPIKQQSQLNNSNTQYECPISGKIFDNITSYESLDISSDPLYMCTCNDNETVCSSSAITMTVYPGGIITVPVLAHGQRNGMTPAVVHNITPKGTLSFNDLEMTQNIPARCTALKYTVHTRAEDTFQQIRLYAEGPCPPSEGTTFATPTSIFTIRFKVAKCPPGFELSDTHPTCTCTQRLQPFTNDCRIYDRSIKRDSEFWMGYTDDKGLILHSHCPFDYCSPNTMYLAVDNSDKQCSNNRSGLLCGQCSQTFSLALGSSRCLQCSDNYLWLLLAFAVAGMLLVLLLLILNLTVAAGTINGLVFYANVLAVNSATFLQPHTTNILTVFIAWINLDLGIETCFYDGMDTYAKTWLQFVFPLYVWSLVMMIIIVSHYSIRISAILSNSTVAVLATLILLSYTKILRTIIAALSHTLLEYPNNSQVAVWLLDGNIGYLSSKHIPLFIAALGFLIFLFLPYTLVLLFGQWIRKSRLKIFSPINNYRILFFLEAYHAPYTEKHRYWTGLMLTLRCLLFLVFAFNTFGNPGINLLCISLTSAVLLILNSLLGNNIYKAVFLNILELSFNSNLCTVAIATFYVRSVRGNQNAVTFTSISAAFVTFLGIVIYHLVQQIRAAPQWWRRLHPSRSYNTDRPAVADSEPRDRALTRPSTAQFATVAYININDIVRAQLAESHV